MEILHLLRLPGVPHVEKEEQEQGLETMGVELVELAERVMPKERRRTEEELHADGNARKSGRQRRERKKRITDFARDGEKRKFWKMFGR